MIAGVRLSWVWRHNVSVLMITPTLQIVCIFIINFSFKESGGFLGEYQTNFGFDLKHEHGVW